MKSLVPNLTLDSKVVGGKLIKLTYRALNALDEVRRELNDNSAKQFPNNSHPSGYYGLINAINPYPLGETKTSPQLNQ